jgi:hypothetical protein
LRLVATLESRRKVKPTVERSRRKQKLFKIEHLEPSLLENKDPPTKDLEIAEKTQPKLGMSDNY